MKYVTLAVPQSLAAIANALGVALEPDPGIDPVTYDAFSTKCEDINGVQYVAYGTEVVDWLGDAVIDWKTNPAALHAAISNEYAARWPALTPPSLAECEAFCSQVLMSFEYGIVMGLEDLNLTLVIPESEV
jgi:hypothetical protein